ncbi:glycosyltransferase [Bradyrhizobium sp. CCGB12]|uniref:CgeB family protein n=1 Tax=Bradyrhizobium sp. CCGB12 TaxID=2949632 RepID=UPI0020B34CA2|nr:glycosyltransferase [Bradyrhizobium sp. CCGB12]MCP3395419.1 glycosyltransferase [Bradyrhizobium sp. CCGB12]
MKIVIFGLTISSSWGNGHATLWRGLCKHLARLGHTIVFFERDVPYYADTRDFFELPSGRLELFASWDEISSCARRHVREADAAIVTSYCHDAVAASHLICSEHRAVSIFYDLDTPVTLARLKAGDPVPYIGSRGLSDFDLVLSFAGGSRIQEDFRRILGAREVRPLYNHVDTDIHRPAPSQPQYRADLSYLGTYSRDRQIALEALLVHAARARQDLRFLIAGAQYPDDFPWSSNMYFVRHLPPSEHAPFFASCRMTLNLTRKAMIDAGWCPSGRLFEAAACGAPLLTDDWPGISDFFAPGDEIMLAHDVGDTLSALTLTDAELQRMARRARERTLTQHTSDKRASELIGLIEQARPGALANDGATV